MATIFECVDSFKKLLDIEYEFILGRKGKSVTLNIKFEKSHFFHLLGLQHLTDMAFALTGSTITYTSDNSMEFTMTL